MRKWYDIKAKKKDEADISLHDEIGMWGVTAKDFIAEFRALTSVSTINLSINSPGGSVFDGLAIFNVMKHSGKTINVMVLGIAASAASLVAMAASPGKLTMPENTFMMIHNPMGISMGNADDMRDMAEILDKIGDGIVGTYAARTGLEGDEIAAMLKSETLMTAAEAVEKGFADTMTAPVHVMASFDVDALPDNLKAAYMAAQPEQPTSSLVADIESVATAAGFKEFAARWALDESIVASAKPLEALHARIGQASETKALCVLCRRPEAADLFISANSPLKEVRAKLLDSQASQDEGQSIDTALKITKPAATSAAVIDVVDVGADIWAKRKQSR